MNLKKEKIEKLKNDVVAFCVNAKEKTTVYISKSKSVMGTKMKNNETALAGVKNIHFNFHHLATLLMIAIFAFLVTFYTTGYNTKKVSAAGFSEAETLVYNEKALAISYGDTKAVAEVAKDILNKEVSALSELTTISSTPDSGVYAIEDYIVSVKLENLVLGNASALLTIEDKATYDKNDIDKVIVTSADGSEVIETGFSYTYEIALNIIDTQAPEIQLKESEITISEDDDFDARSYVASVIDNVDGTLDFSVEGEIESSNDKLRAGEYTITYKAKDNSGNEATASLKVVVEEEEKEETATISSKQTYGSYAESAYAGSIVAEARSHIGKTYIYGANGPNAFDCSGLVQYVYARSGLSIPRTSGGQSGAGVAIDPNDMSQWRAGDIVTFGAGGSSHAAIYSGSGTLIHALNPSLGVRETGVYGFGTIYAVRRIQ